ncbi:nicotinate phosphoribosyltransferase [bacterium]|nr:nicotinate phosphoribosyltransferase [bacterium]
MLRSLLINEDEIGLLTDLYELTMTAAYWSSGLNQLATFELYFRRLPQNRSYIISAGLEQALHYLSSLKFSVNAIEHLRSLEVFRSVNPGFWDFLADLKFTGEVRALAEGTPVFPLEPILQITAPLIEAQIVETYLLAVMNMQSMVATKSARIVRAARGRGCVDFGTRRAHGPQAGLYAARASYIGGCIGTSNVLAGKLCDIPVYGTAAHSFTMSFPTELQAFQAYAHVFPDHSTLLIDTYDTLAAANKVKQVDADVKGVRIDSGDLAELSRQVRKILDRDGLTNVKIFLSSDLNEYKIDQLIREGTPVDFFGVGTELVTSYDDPAMSGVYKIVESRTGGVVHPTIKTSPGKPSFPGKKQVYRFQEQGMYAKDLIGLDSDPSPENGIPLLETYMQNGKLVRTLPSLLETQEFTQQNLAELPESFHELTKPAAYEVEYSHNLKALHDSVAAELKSH